MDKKSIINRRNFFKKTIKLLPIFALGIMGIAPITANAKPVFDCNNTCSSSCRKTCNNKCTTSCGHGCVGTCYLCCKGDCGATCTGCKFSCMNTSKQIAKRDTLIVKKDSIL